MICPFCGHPDSKCLKTEKVMEPGFPKAVTRRRRMCLRGIRGSVCEERFTSFEVTAEDFELLRRMKQTGKFSASRLVSTIDEGGSAGKTEKLMVKPRKKR